MPVNYFYAITGLLMVLFALIGFALGRNRSLGALLGIFFAYVAADESAKFIRDGLNFVLKLELGDEFITYFEAIIFSLGVIGVVGCLFATSYTHRFAGRLKGMLTGALTGYFVSVFALELFRELLEGWPADQTATFDIGYTLLGQEGLLAVTLNFFSDPEAAYAILRKALIPAILVVLLVVLWRAFGGFAKALGKIWGAILKWVSIKAPQEEAKAT